MYALLCSNFAFSAELNNPVCVIPCIVIVDKINSTTIVTTSATIVIPFFSFKLHVCSLKVFNVFLFFIFLLLLSKSSLFSIMNNSPLRYYVILFTGCSCNYKYNIFPYCNQYLSKMSYICKKEETFL